MADARRDSERLCAKPGNEVQVIRAILDHRHAPREWFRQGNIDEELGRRFVFHRDHIGPAFRVGGLRRRSCRTEHHDRNKLRETRDQTPKTWLL